MTKKASSTVDQAAASLKGLRMPAEWEPHAATLLTWPHDGQHWPGWFEGVPAIWARITKELTAGEDVHIVTHDEQVEESAKRELNALDVDMKRVHLHRIPSDFPWARDHGPIVIKNAKGERIFLDFEFNAWGDQWPHDLDDRIPTLLAKRLKVKSVPVSMVLEGGSIDVNGKGTLMTTEDCLLNPDRNPGLTKAEIEQNLKDHLGITNVLWLGKGIMGDDTSGHVDDLARFVGPSTVVTIILEDKKDPDYPALKENLDRLHAMKDQDGQPLKIITIPQPKPVLIKGHAPSKDKPLPEEGFRIPASYANFYIANECVLLPVFGDPNDQKAIDVLTTCFPTRRIVPIDSRHLTWGFGSFHCVTQQIPR